MTQPTAGNTTSITELLLAVVAAGVAAVSPSDVLGDPTAVTAEEGECALRQMIKDVRALVNDGEADADGRPGTVI
ncbi:hypothetical protein [Parafrankia sp. FMc2]|uniref:hypothetical protein n=1 Tax=Parafrankia sp. FMc2 TaxID=3233196 RepID=UPI0034D52DB5